MLSEVRQLARGVRAHLRAREERGQGARDPEQEQALRAAAALPALPAAPARAPPLAEQPRDHVWTGLKAGEAEDLTYRL